MGTEDSIFSSIYGLFLFVRKDRTAISKALFVIKGESSSTANDWKLRGHNEDR
jgi:hypothetical protein